MNNISEPTFFTEKNLVIVAIVIVTIILLKATTDSIVELFEIQKDEEDGLITNFVVDPKTNVINFVSSEDNTSQPVPIAGIIDDMSGNKIMVKFNKVKYNNGKNYLELDGTDYALWDETGMFPAAVINKKEFDEIKSKYTELEISNKNLESQFNNVTTLVTTAEEESKKAMTDLITAEESNKKLMLYGGIGGGVLLLLCIIFTFMAFSKKK
jgi:hypothetical protein